MIEELGFEVVLGWNGWICLSARQNSQAAIVGISPSDKLLRINGLPIAGYSLERVRELFTDKATSEFQLEFTGIREGISSVIVRKSFDINIERELLLGHSAKNIDEMPHLPLNSLTNKCANWASRSLFVYAAYASGRCATALCRRELADSPVALWEILGKIALDLLREGYLDDAHKLFNEILGLSQFGLAYNFSSTQTFRLIISSLYAAAYDEAYQIAIQFSRHYRDLLKDNVINETNWALVQECKCLVQLGRESEALTICKQLSADDKFMHSSGTYFDMEFVASVLERAADLSSAEALYKSIIERKIKRPNHSDGTKSLGRSQQILAKFYLRNQRYSSALEILDGAIERIKAALPLEQLLEREVLGEGAFKDPPLSDFLVLKAQVHSAAERYPEALTVCEEALELRRKGLGEKHLLVAEPLSLQARVYKKIAHEDSAIECATKAYHCVLQSGDWYSNLSKLVAELCLELLTENDSAGNAQLRNELQRKLANIPKSKGSLAGLLHTAQLNLVAAEIDSCLANVRSALQSGEELNTEFAVRNIQSIAHQLIRIKKEDTAAEILEEFSLRLAELYKFQNHRIVGIYFDLSYIYYLRGNLQKCIDSWSKIEAFYAKTMKDAEGHPCGGIQQDPFAEFLRIIALYYCWSGSLTQARYVLDQALASNDPSKPLDVQHHLLPLLLDSQILNVLMGLDVYMQDIAAHLKTQNISQHSSRMRVYPKLMQLIEVAMERNLELASRVIDSISDTASVASIVDFYRGRIAEAHDDRDSAIEFYKRNIPAPGPRVNESEHAHFALRLSKLLFEKGEFRESHLLLFRQLERASQNLPHEYVDAAVKLKWVKLCWQTYKAAADWEPEHSVKVLSALAKHFNHLQPDLFLEVKSEMEQMCARLFDTPDEPSIKLAESLMETLLSLEMEPTRRREIGQKLCEKKVSHLAEDDPRLLQLQMQMIQQIPWSDNGADPLRGSFQDLNRLIKLSFRFYKFGNTTNIHFDVLNKIMQFIAHHAEKGDASIGVELCALIISGLDENALEAFELRLSVLGLMFNLSLRKDGFPFSQHSSSIFEKWLEVYGRLLSVQVFEHLMFHTPFQADPGKLFCALLRNPNLILLLIT